MNTFQFAGIVIAVLFVSAAAAEDARFGTCPVYRDTDMGRKSGCWLADDPADGTRYDVSSSWSKPHWAYGVLVEGTIMIDVPDTCGGIRLDPVRTSVLYDIRCPQHMLPAEGYPGRVKPMSKRYVMPVFVERDIPPPPYKNETFSLIYDFNSDFIIYNLSDYYFDLATAWIDAARPKKVIVTGWAATDPAEVSGLVLREDPDIARARAEVVFESLLRRGVPREIIEVHWKTGAEPSPVEAADGLTESSRRRVDIVGIVE